MDKFKLNQNLVKSPQKLELNYTIYGPMSLEMHSNCQTQFLCITKNH